MMKGIIFLMLLLSGAGHIIAQSDKTVLYRQAMKFYGNKNYRKAAIVFDKVYGDDLSVTRLYNGACIYAMSGNIEKAFSALNLAVEKKFYSNYDQITANNSLAGLQKDDRWRSLLDKILENKTNETVRKRADIVRELNKAKKLLEEDAGKLWGYPVWDDHILVIDYDRTVYSIHSFPGSKTDDGVLFYAPIPDDTLVFVNTVQYFRGDYYATVLTNYLYDHSVTIIHELFHLLQQKHATLNGDAVVYLDYYDAREWLRLEYRSLQNALKHAGKNHRQKVVTYLEDALLFRKIRQRQYAEYLQKEIEIETLEGLANYTGFMLSTLPDRYQSAMDEIYQREQAQTYTRPFPYATGVAYGLLFDFMGIQWKQGLDKVYNFLEVYERNKDISISETAIRKAKARNNYTKIHSEETERKEQNEALIKYYRNLFLEKPVLKVVLVDENYGRTFNMNGTIELPGVGTVYSGITGRDKSGKNFGNFRTIAEKSSLGNAGVLMLPDFMTYIFPEPISIDDNKVTGEGYEIELNEGWVIEKADTAGNYVIRKTGS